jgi:alanine dehydrogenase
VVVFDRQPQVLEAIAAALPGVTTLYAHVESIAQEVRSADLLIGAVLVPGAKAPRIVSRAMIAAMVPGSVVVDIAIDQGGCIETIQPTSYDNPIYVEEGVIHMGVTNLPGAVPETASQALSGAVLPYVLRLATDSGLTDAGLRSAINVRDGQIVHPAILASG